MMKFENLNDAIEHAEQLGYTHAKSVHVEEGECELYMIGENFGGGPCELDEEADTLTLFETEEFYEAVFSLSRQRMYRRS